MNSKKGEKRNDKKGGGKIKKGLKKFWFLLWEDNSFKGWLFSLIFLFVFIQYIFFPALNFVTGTSLPLAIVESCSMYHQGNFFSNFNQWFERKSDKYQDFNIALEEFSKFSLRRGFSKGDIIFIMGVNTDKLKVGDVIAFNSGTKGTPVIHRVIRIKEIDGERIFTTMGDNNNEILIPTNNLGNVDEREIKSSQIVGKALIRLVPEIGWAKLIFFEGAKPYSERGFCEEN